jgi:hypothetical protein
MARGCALLIANAILALLIKKAALILLKKIAVSAAFFGCLNF